MSNTRRKTRPLSFTQLRWLRALAAGEDPRDYLEGQSEHGGANGTIYSLSRRGLITDLDTITEAGRRAVEWADWPKRKVRNAC